LGEKGLVMKNKKGFTLIELMVVVIIIGILATIAIPSFNKSMENAREREARTTLELIYNAEKIYRLDKKTYSDSFDNMISYLDDPNGASQYYDYTIDSADTVTFTATATKNDGSGNDLSIDQTGQIAE